MSPSPVNDEADLQGVGVVNKARVAALAENDQADFSSAWWGVGFFTDAYDIFAISIASTMLGYTYGNSVVPSTQLLTLDANQDLGIKVAAPVGTLVGQLLFGWLADMVGRKRMYGLELIIIIIATFGQAAVNVINVLIVWRVIMGIGIEGDYPLSTVISSEFSSTLCGRLMTAVFANRGWAQLVGSLVALIIVAAYKNALTRDITYVDYMWRLLIGLGCVPGAITLYFRLTIPETPRFTMDVELKVKQAARDVGSLLTTGSYYVDPDAVYERAQAPRATRTDFASYFGQRENLLLLVGTSYSWFVLDIAFYRLSLNSAKVLEIILGATPDAFENLRRIAVGNVILSVAGYIPGYWAMFLVIDRLGRKPIQLMGFVVLTVLFILMGKRFLLTPRAFVFLYCLANFFQNFGPNTVTFIVPGGAFPTRYRSTAHGISEASGKLGAIVSQVRFAKMIDIGGQPGGSVFFDPRFFMLTGVFSTLLIKETNQKTLEDISNERQDQFVMGTPPQATLLLRLNY
ncbi:hypothetical protein V8D89_001428 [Ganoderma adspersum]